VWLGYAAQPHPLSGEFIARDVPETRTVAYNTRLAERMAVPFVAVHAGKLKFPVLFLQYQSKWNK